MRCIACKKTCEEVELHEGILEDGMVLICSTCAEKEGIPLIRKPTQKQLSKADKRYSVRERMERLSGTRRTSISEDQTIVQGNLAKLKRPSEKQKHPDLFDDYYWRLNISRRRKKLSINQLSNQIKISPEIISDIEKGVIPKDFEEIFSKIEDFFGIQLIRNPKKRISFRPISPPEKEILEQVKIKMNDLNNKKEKIKEIEKGDMDFSKRENLEDLTLNDLIEMKRKRDRINREMLHKQKIDSFVGEDLEIEEL
jgi:ribosome-binding protein aMBF1 (putative translation factor)